MKANDNTPAIFNPKAPRRATLDDIRAIAGYEHLIDSEAQGILDSIRQFASLMANFIQKKQEHE